MATRTFVFYVGANGRSLELESQLAISFTPPITDQLYETQIPCFWKVFQFRPSTGGDRQSATATWSQLFGFSVDQINVDKEVAPDDWISVGLGQSTTATGSKESYTFTPPTPVPSPGQGLLTATNCTDRMLPMSIGTISADGNAYYPILQWSQVPVGTSIVGQITPTMQVYAVQGYQAGTLIQAELQTQGLFKAGGVSKPINVADLPETTYWNFYSEPRTGEYKIEQLQGPAVARDQISKDDT